EERGNAGRIRGPASRKEPLIRVMAEGQSQEQLEEIVEDIASVIDQELGVRHR
ncbi:MAG TPA: phosphoglucosamine mutase, partial [Veillonellaceae bacterium]|nr:phosphoglucosamine mutase [Veillonellaceae bacterium]